MTYLKTILIATLLMIVSSTALTYDKVALELNSKINFTTEDIAGIDVETGYGVEFALSYNFMEQLGVYVGWGWDQYVHEASRVNTGFVFDEMGYTFGLQFVRPFGSSEELSYLLKVGGIYNKVSIEPETSGARVFGPELGWEIAAGVQYDLGKTWYLRPQIGYRSLTGDDSFSGYTYDFKLNNIAFGLGIAKSF
ncbi:MAG: outer membrane beta-barrel protein [Candidatus Kapaibacterium sp.]|nr:outer membrane beta-barrel protein [Ignavibacteriota bacterium]